MTAVVARIILRYAAATLVAYGVLTSDLGEMLGGDEDAAAAVEIALGAVLGMVTEGWYYVAKRYGWST
jgi:hypothetical protein